MYAQGRSCAYSYKGKTTLIKPENLVTNVCANFLNLHSV